MALRRLYKGLLSLVLIIALLAALSFGALVAWVVTGPRSLDAFTPYVESSINKPDGAYKVKIGSSLLLWDGWQHPIGVRVRNLDVLDAQGKILAHFPEVGVRMYLLQLLMGKIDLKSVELLGPTTRLVQDAQGNITSFGFSSSSTDTNTPIGPTLAFLTTENNDTPLAHLRSFVIKHASLSVDDSQGKAFLSSSDAGIEIKREHGIAKGKLTMPLLFDGKKGEIDLRFTVNGNAKSVSSDIAFSEVPSTILYALAPSQQWMGRVQVPLSGVTSMTSDFDAHIQTMNFMLLAGKGTLDFPDQLEKPLTPQNIKVVGSIGDQLNTITIKEAAVDFGGPSLNFSGVIHRQGDDVGVEGQAETQNVPIDEVGLYWPLKLAPHSRHWVVTRLSKGKITKATVQLHFKPGDFKLKDTPEADIDANITVRGVTAVYKPGHPSVTDIDGTIRFTGRTMDAKISSAKYLSDTHVEQARLRFVDFYPDDVRMVVDADVKGPMKDVQSFLSLPDLNKAAKLNLTPDIAGQASGNAKLDFIAFSENDKNDVGATGKMDYAINATITRGAQNKFMGKRDIADADVALALDNKGVKVKGKAKVNNVPMNIDLTSSFAKGNETNYVIKADMPVARLPDFGLPKLDFVKGMMGVNASFVTSDTTDKADATLDLTRTSITLPQHGFIKKDGERVTLKVATESPPEGGTFIKSFSFKGEGYDLGGSAVYDGKIGDFTSFTLAPLKFGSDDMDSVEFARSGDSIKLIARGRSFNATPYLSDSADKNPRLNIAMDLKANRLILGDNRELKEVAIQADCPADACRSANVNAKLKDNTPFLYTIAGGKLDSTCDNAGELARVFAIFDTIDGGKMHMTGAYKEGALQGNLEVTGYTLKNAPVLTKMFTIASLTGIIDTLVGKGIYFDRLTAPFAYHGGVLILKDAKTHGAAMGFTADGVIDTNKSTVDLKGVIVPSYTLNSLVGNVPLIGNILQGGSGKGLVAISYGMSGPMKNPSISVNPLSALTPGFLRDIFNIFDKPAPDIDALQPKTAVPAVTAPAATSAVPATPVVTPAAPAPLSSTLPSTDELKK